MREPSRYALDPRRGRPLAVATVAAGLVLAGAGTAPLPAQVVPDTVQPAPAHRGAESPRIPPGDQGAARVPPRATAPHVLLTRAGQPLSGAFELSGTLRRGDESRLLVFEPADPGGEPILIGYALPGDMQVAVPEGPVRLTARAEPELPTSTYSVSLAQERTAALGVVWAVEPEPVTFRAGPLRIRQRGEPGGESRAVPAVVEGGEQARELPLGEALTVMADGQRYSVYLQSSAFLRSPDDSDGPETAFLLRASVVLAEGR